MTRKKAARDTKPEPKYIKNVPENVSFLILSIYMHWNKDQILLIYSPTFTVTQALGLV